MREALDQIVFNHQDDFVLVSWLEIVQAVHRRFMLLDHGGTEESFSPNQLDCGMGMFTLLDGHGPQNEGLVQLSSTPGFYFNPALGEPTPETFVDTASAESSRLFGQGAALEVRNRSVGYIPSQ